MDILIKPIITEKTIRLADELNQYTFLVKGHATKITVSEAISKKFDVGVESVRMINTLGKRVTFGRGRRPGKRSNYKKALVTLKSGDSLELFNVS